MNRCAFGPKWAAIGSIAVPPEARYGNRRSHVPWPGKITHLICGRA